MLIYTIYNISHGKMLHIKNALFRSLYSTLVAINTVL